MRVRCGSWSLLHDRFSKLRDPSHNNCVTWGTVGRPHLEKYLHIGTEKMEELAARTRNSN